MSILTVVGIGNRLYCDDGIGCEIVERLSAMKIDRRVELLIGETDFDYCLANIRTKNVIIVDAVMAGDKPGNVRLFKPEECLPFLSVGISMHNLHILQLMKASENSNFWVIGIEPYEILLRSGLSKSMKLSVDTIVEVANNIINKALMRIIIYNE